jgi:hypothetical protein
MDSDPAAAIFLSDLQDGNKTLFCAHYFLKPHLHHFEKVKSHKEVTKQKESRFFLLFLLDDRMISSRIRTSDKRTNGSGSRRPQKHTDPTDPDPQH